MEGKITNIGNIMQINYSKYEEMLNKISSVKLNNISDLDIISVNKYTFSSYLSNVNELLEEYK